MNKRLLSSTLTLIVTWLAVEAALELTAPRPGVVTPQAKEVLP